MRPLDVSQKNAKTGPDCLVIMQKNLLRSMRSVFVGSREMERGSCTLAAVLKCEGVGQIAP